MRLDPSEVGQGSWAWDDGKKVMQGSTGRDDGKKVKQGSKDRDDEEGCRVRERFGIMGENPIG